jgi:hypothetical protein
MGGCISRPSVRSDAYAVPAASDPGPSWDAGRTALPATVPAAPEQSQPRAAEPALRGPTPPPLPQRPLQAAAPMAPRVAAPQLRPAPGTPAGDAAAARAATRQERMADEDLPVAGYLLARASVGRKVDDPATVQALSSGQKAVDRGVESLHLGRGNVAADLWNSEDEAYVAVQIQRDAVNFLRSSIGYQPPEGDPTPMSRRMSRLERFWPRDFNEALRRHFPEPQAAEQAVHFIAKTLAARHYAAGNCGEHARVVAHERSRMDDAPPTIRIARSDYMDHAWAEAKASASELRDDDVLMDGWMRTVAHLREDSHCGSVAHHTRAQFDDAQARWMAGVVEHVGIRLERDGVLAKLTEEAEGVVRAKVQKEGITGAYGAVNVNLRPEFLGEARQRTWEQSALSVAVETAGVARSFGQPVAAATSDEVQQPILWAREVFLRQLAPPPWDPAVE